MTNEMKSFLELLSSDTELAAKVQALVEAKDVAGLIGLAASKGFTLTQEDLQNEVSAPAMQDGELDDDELEAVGGGWRICTCVFGGGGKADSDGKACACVGYGLGEAREGNSVNAVRCVCGLAGTGESPDMFKTDN